MVRWGTVGSGRLETAMRRAGWTLLVTAVVALLPATAQASPVRECGRVGNGGHGAGVGIVNLTTRNVSCANARRFALQVTPQWPLPRHWHGFTGRLHSYNTGDGGHHVDLRYVRGGQVIRWQIGD
jgi:hypothetical protein